MGIRLDEEQNFSCRGCAECCTRGFEIFVTAAERERYETAGARRWFRDEGESSEGTDDSPFVPVPGGGYSIRKRRDGACGFLSGERRCRIHEELGGDSKPLTCQMFPFSFEFRGDDVFVQQSFICPTIVENTGRPAADDQKTIGSLARHWRKELGVTDAPREWVKGVAIDEATLDALRWALRRVLDRHPSANPDESAGGAFSLRRNVLQIGALLDDWTRRRVLKLAPEARAEYIKLTAEFAACAARPGPAPPAPSRLARLLQRGFFFASIAPWIQRRNAARSGPALRLRLFRLLAHIHGLGGAVDGVDFRRTRNTAIPIDDEPFFSPAYHVLRAAIENIGVSRRPVVEALNLAAAHVAVAETLYLARSATDSGAAPAWIRALTEAHDVAQSDPESALGRVLTLLCPPPAGWLILGSRVAAKGATSSA